MIRILVVLAVLSALGFSQSAASSRYESKFENDVVAVYDIDLPAHESASTLQAAHDSFWLSLASAEVSFSREKDKIDVAFQPGDARFFPSFETKLLTNTGATEFRGVLVALKPRALIPNGCECTGSTGKTVCGCKGAGHLDSLWALSLGDVTLAGTSLAAGEAFRSAAPREDMLLVAITGLSLEDHQAGAGSDSETAENTLIRLKPGEATWIKGGRHQFQNAGTETARFVTFEF